MGPRLATKAVCVAAPVNNQTPAWVVQGAVSIRAFQDARSTVESGMWAAGVLFPTARRRP
jgi:hypothetical protein